MKTLQRSLGLCVISTALLVSRVYAQSGDITSFQLQSPGQNYGQSGYGGSNNQLASPSGPKYYPSSPQAEPYNYQPQASSPSQQPYDDDTDQTNIDPNPSSSQPNDQILSAARNAKEIISDDMRRAAGGLNAVKGRLSKLTNDVSSLNNAGATSQNELRKLRGNLNDIDNTLQERKKQGGMLGKKSRDLRSNLNAIQQQLYDNDRNIKDEEDHKKKILNRIDHLNSKNEAIGKKISQKEDEIGKIRRDFHDLNRKLDKGKNGLARVDDIVKKELNNILKHQNDYFIRREPIQPPTKIDNPGSVISLNVECPMSMKNVS